MSPLYSYPTTSLIPNSFSGIFSIKMSFLIWTYMPGIKMPFLNWNIWELDLFSMFDHLTSPVFLGEYKHTYSTAVRQPNFFLAAAQPRGFRHPPSCWNLQGVGCRSIRQSPWTPAVFLSQIAALSIAAGKSRNLPTAIVDAAICDNFFIFCYKLRHRRLRHRRLRQARNFKTKRRGKSTIIPSRYFDPHYRTNSKLYFKEKKH